MRVDGAGRFNVEKLRVFDDALLKTEKFPGRVRFQRRRKIQQAAEIVKMGLVGSGFLGTDFSPLGFEFSRCHRAERSK